MAEIKKQQKELNDKRRIEFKLSHGINPVLNKRRTL